MDNLQQDLLLHLFQDIYKTVSEDPYLPEGQEVFSQLPPYTVQPKLPPLTDPKTWKAEL